MALEVAIPRRSARSPGCCRRRASDARAGGAGLDMIRGDLPAARRTVGFRPATLIREELR